MTCNVDEVDESNKLPPCFFKCTYMSTKYKINTIQDMIDCTNESNLDNFIIDLKGFLSTAHLIRKLGKKIKSSVHPPKTEHIIWIDDNDHNLTIQLSEKKEK